MWLSTRITHIADSDRKDGDRKETCCDRLLALSPEIVEEPVTQTLLIPLARVSAYWNLAALWDRPEEAARHPFYALLKDLNDEFDLRFVVAPTAPWALWVHHHAAKPLLLNHVDADAFREDALSSSPARLAELAPDLLSSPEARARFDYFVDSCAELGILSSRKLLELPTESLSERFGPGILRILKRLRGHDELHVEAYVPSLTLSKTFHPAFEKAIASDDEPDLLSRLQTTLVSWEQRLEARRSLLRGLRLTVRSEHRDHAEAFFVTLPRASRNASALFEILREKWFALAGRTSAGHDETFEDHIAELTIESLGLEPENDHQLDLFDPHKMAREEAWSTLLARLQARSTQRAPVHAGHWLPVESYLPERAFEWVEAGAAGRVPFLQDHPARPLHLFKTPQRIEEPTVQSEEEFLKWVEGRSALKTLERLSDIWDFDCRRSERSYARVENQWVFWDHVRSQLYVHGHF